MVIPIEMNENRELLVNHVIACAMAREFPGVDLGLISLAVLRTRRAVVQGESAQGMKQRIREAIQERVRMSSGAGSLLRVASAAEEFAVR